MKTVATTKISIWLRPLCPTAFDQHIHHQPTVHPSSRRQTIPPVPRPPLRKLDCCLKAQPANRRRLPAPPSLQRLPLPAHQAQSSLHGLMIHSHSAAMAQTLFKPARHYRQRWRRTQMRRRYGLRALIAAPLVLRIRIKCIRREL